MIFAVPAARLAGLVDAIAPAYRCRGRPDRQCLVGGAGDGRAPRPRLPAELRCAGSQRRTVARQSNHAVVAEVGPAHRRRAVATLVRPFRRRPGDPRVRRRAAGLGAGRPGHRVRPAVEPVDVHVQRWPDAMPQYGPGHRDLVAELRAGLPSTCQVAGSYLDGIGVPACVGAAGRAAAAADPGRRNARGTIVLMARLDYDALNSTVRYLMFSVFSVRAGELGDAAGKRSSTKPRPSSSSAKSRVSWSAASTTSPACGPTPTS